MARLDANRRPYQVSRQGAGAKATIRAAFSTEGFAAMPLRRSLRLRPLASLAVLALLGVAGVTFGADPKVLNIYNWSDYIADDTIKNFEKETGIKVNYDNYDTNEVLQAKLVAGNTGYDIVVPSSHFAKLQIEGGLLQKLDRSRLTNWGNLDPTLLKQLANVDPGNQYLVDWLWGYVTVGINVPKVKAALGSLPMPDNAWSLIFDPKYAAKLKSCGVNFLDSASEVLPVAMLYVGKPAYSTNAADYDAAAKMLQTVRPYVTRFSSSGYINDLAGGSLCAVMGYSGDINISRARALDANPKQPATIEALIPKGGATLFFDTMAIPKDAKNVANAHLFINYILRPEVAAALTNKVFYANPNAASLKFVKKDVAENKTIFLSADDKARMTPPDAVPQAIRRVQTRIFTNFKAGR
jgi:putrescine transport system substrate-binding protein